MKGILTNKLLLIGIVAVVLITLGVVFVYFNSDKKQTETVEEEIVEEQAKEINPEDIGLELVPNSDNTEVEMTITKTDTFNSFEYEMNYDAEVVGEMVPRGAIGSGESDGKTITRSITIGTCSSGKCKYDKGVSKISLIVRLNLKDGSIGVAKKDLSLE